VLNKIVSAVQEKSGEIFFLYGPGGTGKTFLYNTLCHHLHAQNKIVLCVAFSGIASILLKGGHTAHSCFKIPIPAHESTTCGFSKNSQLAELIHATDLVIWDEAPMQHRHVMETVDCSFQDMCGSDSPFGGLNVVFGGDFKQIVPVIVKGSCAQIVNACIQWSTLWSSMTVLHLKHNMQLNLDIEAEQNFAKWQLEVGQGLHTDPGGNITLPNYFCCPENTVESLINSIYPGINAPNLPDSYFSEHTILSSKNDNVNSLNQQILNLFPGQMQVFHSADSIPPSAHAGEEDAMLNYPVEYLNSINCSGLPLAALALKPGCPVMILRNLNPAKGVCNGSRGIVTQCRNCVLEVWLLTGDHAGEIIFIPWISLSPSEDQVPFKFIC
jgi:hypothetical protein